jgi:hypothetical protein
MVTRLDASRHISGPVDPAGMASQRLLKMMDPLGHVSSSRRMLASLAPTAVVWAPAPRTAAWITRELGVIGVEPLRATSFRHVDASLRIETHPRCALAVIDFGAVSAANIATLTTARWAGYRGPIVAVAAPGVVSRETEAIIRIDAIVSPGSDALHEIVARLIAH